MSPRQGQQAEEAHAASDYSILDSIRSGRVMKLFMNCLMRMHQYPPTPVPVIKSAFNSGRRLLLDLDRSQLTPQPRGQRAGVTPRRDLRLLTPRFPGAARGDFGTYTHASMIHGPWWAVGDEPADALCDMREQAQKAAGWPNAVGRAYGLVGPVGSNAECGLLLFDPRVICGPRTRASLFPFPLRLTVNRTATPTPRRPKITLHLNQG
jgi:hypothetical protein